MPSILGARSAPHFFFFLHFFFLASAARCFFLAFLHLAAGVVYVKVIDGTPEVSRPDRVELVPAKNPSEPPPPPAAADMPVLPEAPPPPPKTPPPPPPPLPPPPVPFEPPA